MREECDNLGERLLSNFRREASVSESSHKKEFTKHGYIETDDNEDRTIIKEYKYGEYVFSPDEKVSEERIDKK